MLGLAACTATPAREAAVKPAPRVVSLNPCTDAILAEVADPRQLLALSHYSRDPASSSMDPRRAARFPSVSGTVEEVLALRPDVVVSGTFTPPATVDAFARLNIRLVQMPIATSVEQSKAQVAQLAALAGHPARGAALNARIDQALAAAAPKPGPKSGPKPGHAPIPAVVWQSGGIVPGPDTLIADLLRRTGFAHFSAARGLKQADALPLERLLADPPRVILAAGNARSAEDRMLAHPALDALGQTRRAPFDPSLLWCGGPTIVRAAERLAAVRASL